MKQAIVVALCCVLLAQLLFIPANINSVPVQADNEPDEIWYVMDLTTTPLAKGIEQAYQGMSNKPEGYKHDKETNPARLKNGEKTVGRASRNEVTINYKDASQKGKSDADWDPVEIKIQPDKGLPDVEESFFLPATTNESRGEGAKNASAGFFSNANDDADCIDTVTGNISVGLRALLGNQPLTS